MSAHLLPKFRWACINVASSWGVHGSLLMLGSKWLYHLYTHNNIDDFGEDPHQKSPSLTQQGKSLLLFRIANENLGAFWGANLPFTALLANATRDAASYGRPSFRPEQTHQLLDALIFLLGTHIYCELLLRILWMRGPRERFAHSVSLCLCLSFLFLCMIPQSSKIRTWVWTDRESGPGRRSDENACKRTSAVQYPLTRLGFSTFCHRCKHCTSVRLSRHAAACKFPIPSQVSTLSDVVKTICKEGRTFASWVVLIASHSAHGHQNWKSNNIERERERERERAQDFPPFPPTDLFPGPAFEALHCCT